MKEIRLWSLEQYGKSALRAEPVAAVRDTETEQLLEELLVNSPELLMHGLRLVGRQVPTQGGPLDLLGVDESGHLVLFELKRGTLTREAVAQAIDYASDLHTMDLGDLARHLAERSGHHGIDKIEDFRDWYDQTYPGSSDALDELPRIVLVGLGADERTIRMVNFLAESALDIQLLTFHVFREEDHLFLAKHIETKTRSASGGGGSEGGGKQANLAFFTAKLQELEVVDLFESVRGFVRRGVPGAYEWPGKFTYTFSLAERLESGRPSNRVYIAVTVHDNRPRHVTLSIYENAYDAAPEAVAEFQKTHASWANLHPKYRQVDMDVTEQTWSKAAETLEPLLPVIVEGWRAKQAAESEGEDD